MEIPVPASVKKSKAFVQRVRIHLEAPISAACYEFAIYKELKHTLQQSYTGSDLAQWWSQAQAGRVFEL
jgi:hypothetical protein